MKRLLTSTDGGKAGAIDGLNLFFGALLGANLGTLDRMPLGEYVKLIFLLAGTVMALRMISTSERRGYMAVVILIYGLLIAGMATLPPLQPKGMNIDDLHRLVATLGIWVAFVLASEFSPMEKKPAPAIPADEITRQPASAPPPR
jgi:hypothetical protein